MPGRNEIIAQRTASVGSFNVSYIDATCAAPSVVERATGQIQWQKLDPQRFPYHPEAPKKDPSRKLQNVSEERWGSGGLIDHDLFLTAAHIPQPQCNQHWVTPYYSKSDEQLPAHRLARLMKVNFNYQHTFCTNDSFADTQYPPTHNENSFEVAELVEYGFGIGNNKIDYAIFRLKGSPGLTYGWAGISISPLARGVRLYVWQHPEGNPKKLAGGECLGTNAGNPDLIDHNANTNPGSSGAVPSADGENVCGVHIQGNKNTGINHAVSMSAIWAVSRVVQHLVSKQDQRALITFEQQQQWAAPLPIQPLQQETKPDNTALWVVGGLGVLGLFGLGLYALSQSSGKNKSGQAPGPASRSSSAIHQIS